MKIILAVLVCLLCGCSERITSLSDLPQKGELQCAVGLQTMGCQYDSIRTYGSGYYKAECVFPVKGFLICPVASGVIIALAEPVK